VQGGRFILSTGAVGSTRCRCPNICNLLPMPGRRRRPPTRRCALWISVVVVTLLPLFRGRPAKAAKGKIIPELALERRQECCRSRALHCNLFRSAAGRKPTAVVSAAVTETTARQWRAGRPSSSWAASSGRQAFTVAPPSTTTTTGCSMSSIQREDNLACHRRRQRRWRRSPVAQP
jgi:hypothetical protein